MIPLPASLHGSLDAPAGPEIDRVMRECGRTARLALEDVHGVLARLEEGLDDRRVALGNQGRPWPRSREL